MQTDSELESDTSSIHEAGSSSNLVHMATAPSSSAILAGSSVPREQLDKRVESLVQENRVLKMEIDTYKLRVRSLQEDNKELRKIGVNIQV